jgi:hypothetical protein
MRYIDIYNLQLGPAFEVVPDRMNACEISEPSIEYIIC